jgi:hypothetical protein
MTIRDLFKWVCVMTGVVAWWCWAPCMARVVNYDNHPMLAEALSHDLEMNGGDYLKADRAVAEKQYLAYLEARKDLPSFQKARIYTQLGALYTTAINENKGEERDLRKARSYFEKALVSEPNRVGLATLRARSFLSELKPEIGFDRVKSLMGYYEYLGKLDEKTVRRLWLPERPDEEPLASNDPNVRDAYSAAIPQQQVAAMLKYIAALKRLQVRNSITNAECMAEPAEGLLYILEHVPDGAPEKEEVRKALSKLSDRAAHDELNTILGSSRAKGSC